jgi:hypothetical protein
MTNIDYSKFTSEDFLKDTYFLKSIKTPTKESNAFWKEQLLTEKIQEKEFRVAKNIILSANIPHHTITEEELSELWNKIEKSNKQKPLQRHSRLIQFAAVAASLAILFALSYTFWSKQSNNGSSLISIAKLMQVQGDSSAVQLILNNDKNITLDQENVTIEYNATGDVIVNKQQVAHNIASNTNGPAQLSETNTYNQLIVPKGKRSSIVFGDGTKLWVNSGSRIVYPISFKKDKREIYVEGEVYLEVTKDKTRPFIVSTNKMNIAVFGNIYRPVILSHIKVIFDFFSDKNAQSHKAMHDFLLKGIELANECDLKFKVNQNQRLLVELCLMQLASITFDGEKKK